MPLSVATALGKQRAERAEIGVETAWNYLEAGIRWELASAVSDSIRGVPDRHLWDASGG